MLFTDYFPFKESGEGWVFLGEKRDKGEVRKCITWRQELKTQREKHVPSEKQHFAGRALDNLRCSCPSKQHALPHTSPNLTCTHMQPPPSYPGLSLPLSSLQETRRSSVRTGLQGNSQLDHPKYCLPPVPLPSGHPAAAAKPKGWMKPPQRGEGASPWLCSGTE